MLHRLDIQIAHHKGLVNWISRCYRRFMPRPRTQAQKEAEKRAEAESHGKTLVRHTAESAADLAKLRERFPKTSDPALIRLAMRELAKKGNR